MGSEKNPYGKKMGSETHAIHINHSCVFSSILSGQKSETRPPVLNLCFSLKISLIFAFIALIPYDMTKFVTCKKKPFHGIGVSGGFHNKSNNLLPGTGHGGGDSSEDGCGQFLHTIQVGDGDHNSALSIEIELQASPALNNPSFASDQGDEQPPPDGSSSNSETETESVLEEEPEFNWSGVAKTFLLLSAEEVLATTAIRFGAGDSLTENSRILLSSAHLCSVAATFFSSCGYILERSSGAQRAARLITIGGAVAMMCTLALLTGSLFTNL